MKTVIVTGMIGMMLMLSAAGCSNKDKNASAKNSSALDIAPEPAPTATYQPPTTVVDSQPVIYDSAITQTPTASGSGTYTVQRGDTLYGIARQRYGDGKQWQKIASANPGVDPSRLPVGKTLVIP